MGKAIFRCIFSALLSSPRNNSISLNQLMRSVKREPKMCALRSGRRGASAARSASDKAAHLPRPSDASQRRKKLICENLLPAICCTTSTVRLLFATLSLRLFPHQSKRSTACKTFQFQLESGRVCVYLRLPPLEPSSGQMNSPMPGPRWRRRKKNIV